MTDIGVHDILKATSATLAIDATKEPFDIVRIYTKEGSQIKLFLAGHTGQKIANAINEAVKFED